ncbi:TetR/AcrR family transcriptional regulator [Tissierella praeacuta]|uniref:TetR/AcrR family transcriptional regulator n=1 Tax=Tissierella praeacuta TaxID=43131 RepID=UPI00334290C0
MVQTKRQEQKEFTRRRILDTAFRLYEVGGFSMPTNVIAQEAGISHGTIFVHFPTKKSLQLHVLERFAKEMGNKLHHLSAAGNNISELLHAHINVLKEYEQFYKTLITELSSLPDETKTILLSLQSTISLHFSVAVERGQQTGTVKDIPLHVLFNTWMGLLHYYLRNSELFAPGASVLDRRRDELVDGFIALISK